ncbi:MAG TPA: YtxH domain-containing protein [Bryobacterales bacterium]|nr:YtxH domain-containing protein [Bryobacterales bacterium]
MADDNTGDKLVWFFAGVAVGAAAAILLAPRTGREIRQLIGERASEGRDKLVETGRDLYGKGRDLFEKGKDIAEDAADLFERGRKAVKL